MLLLVFMAPFPRSTLLVVVGQGREGHLLSGLIEIWRQFEISSVTLLILRDLNGRSYVAPIRATATRLHQRVAFVFC